MKSFGLEEIPAAFRAAYQDLGGRAGFDAGRGGLCLQRVQGDVIVAETVIRDQGGDFTVSGTQMELACQRIGLSFTPLRNRLMASPA